MGRLFALGLTLTLALAGCLQLPEDPDELADQPIEGRTGGTMSAEETRTDDASLCTDGLDLSDQRFCAVRTITVKGTLAGFPALDVALETFNGDVTITEGNDGAWGFVATLKGRGASAEAATAQIGSIDFSWAHEDAGAHFVEVAAKHEGEARNLEAAIALTMPRALVMSLVATTSNGDVELAGGKTDKLALITSNGKIVARGEVEQVSLTTSNGDIEADLRPTGDGRWALITSNGDVRLTVPEGGEYGYRIDGTTSNGEVDYTLRDGEKGPCPQGSEYYTPPCNHRSFETRGYNGRDIQVSATLTTSNGEVSAGPK